MSHRAIQRLRKERETQLKLQTEESDDDEDEHEVATVGRVVGGAVSFAAMMVDDSDDDDSENEDDDDKKSTGDKDEWIDSKDNHRDDDDPSGKAIQTSTTSKTANSQIIADKTKELSSEMVAIDYKADDDDDDLDAIIEEFKVKDEETADETKNKDENSTYYFDVITTRMDVRDLDIDYVMRTALLGSTSEESSATTRSNQRRGRQVHFFGPPRDNCPKPPHYVGGGIGMTSYDNNNDQNVVQLPWPYSDMKEVDEKCPELDRWFKFIYSDSYRRDCDDYDRVKASGDPNALALFVAHHPFVVEALLQLSAVLYQTNQSQEGLSLLKRALFVFECASLKSFLKIEKNQAAFMDNDLPENNLFFSALFRLVRVSHVAGLSRASLAASRLLLSLDPLRDPMGVLLAIDYFALVSNMPACDKWLVELVESNKISVFHKDETNSEGYRCRLLDMPNWAYSYALALHRINQNEPTQESEEKANDSIKDALKRFPRVLDYLLAKNDVDITGRSFEVDWPAVLPFVAKLSRNAAGSDAAAMQDPVIRACTSQAFELVVKIFVQQNFKLWSSDKVLQWLYNNLKNLMESGNSNDVLPLSPALMRYIHVDPSDFEDKFQTMPVDANPLDPGLVAHALTVDLNRPRFMQRLPRGGRMLDGLDFGTEDQQGAMVAGPPTELIDPDWPLLEVFWRSALPWAHVEGVPPPQL